MSPTDSFRFVYAIFGLVVGTLFLASSLYLVLRGLDRDKRRWALKIGRLELTDASSGVALAALGVLVIYLTRLG